MLRRRLLFAIRLFTVVIPYGAGASAPGERLPASDVSGRGAVRAAEALAVGEPSGSALLTAAKSCSASDLAVRGEVCEDDGQTRTMRSSAEAFVPANSRPPVGPSESGAASSWTLDDASKLGDFLSGTGTWAAVVVALAGMVTWAKQRRHERRAEAAARLLVAATSAARSLHSYCFWAQAHAQIVIDKPGAPAKNDIRTMLERMHGEAASALGRVSEATVQATPYLAESDLEWANELRAIEFAVLAWTDTITNVERTVRAEEIDAAARSFEEEGKKAQNLEKAASRKLGPIARYEQWWERIAAETDRDLKRDFGT